MFCYPHEVEFRLIILYKIHFKNKYLTNYYLLTCNYYCKDFYISCKRIIFLAYGFIFNPIYTIICILPHNSLKNSFISVQLFSYEIIKSTSFESVGFSRENSMYSFKVVKASTYNSTHERIRIQ